jgi:ankyrin repeat protein
MTEWNSEDRISASELMDSILGYKDSHAYYASCCKFDDDEDDGHMSSYHGSASEDEDYASAGSVTRGTTVSASEVYTPRSIARNLSEFEAHEAKNFKIPRFPWQENTSTISRQPVASSPVEIKLPRLPWQENTSTKLQLPPAKPPQNAFAGATSARPLSTAVEKEEIAEPIAHSKPEEPVPQPSLAANVLQDGVSSPHSKVGGEISPQKADVPSASKKQEVGCSVDTLLPATVPSPTKTDGETSHVPDPENSVVIQYGPNSPKLRAGPRVLGSRSAANTNPFLRLLTSTRAVGMPLNTAEFSPPPTHVETDPYVSMAHSADCHTSFTSQSTTVQSLMDSPLPEFDVDAALSRWSNFFEFESLVLKLRSDNVVDWRKSLNSVVAATGADPSANSALHFAVRLSNPQIAVDVTVALLENSILTRAADVKAVNIYGNTPLHEAVKEGHLTLIKLLIVYGAETSTKNLRGQNALHLAVKTSRLDVVRHVVNCSSAETMHAKTNSGKTPLELSTEDEITTFLTKRMTKPDVQGEAEPSSGDRPGPGLEYRVVGSPRQESNANLLAVDADATMLRKLRSTSHLDDPILQPEIEASRGVSQGPVESAGYLDEKILATEPASPPPVKRKINFKELSWYRALLERQEAEQEGTAGNGTSQATRTLSARRKPNISLEPAVLAQAEKRLGEAGFKGNNSFRKFPTVALIWTLENLAIVSPLDGIVTLLLRSGAEIDTVNDHGQTMMHLAAKYGMVYIAEILLKFGAHTELRDRSQLVPLHYAIKFEIPEVVSLLLDHGADIEAIGDDLHRPLSYAIEKGNRTVVNLLLAKGADIHNSPKRHPLLYAAQLDRWHIVADLLYQRPLINLENKDSLGNTAVHYAVKAGELDLLRQLFNRGVDMTVKNVKGKTPLDLARECKGMENYRGIVELLGGKAVIGCQDRQDKAVKAWLWE